jgi:Overcoming lysogenization defect protein-like, TOPRIM domain
MSSADEATPRGPRPPLSLDDAQRLVIEAKANTVVLVEGWSDQAAIETLARRAGLDLGAMAVVVLPMGGATNANPFALRFGMQGLRLRLAGLYDLPEQRHFLRAVCADTVTSAPSQADAERLGFYACNEDLEDELIRALGPQAVEQVIAAEGEIGAFRRFQAQPAQQGRSLAAHLRRFIGTRAGRKIRYGALLAAALDLNSIPSPLSQLLARLASSQ